MEPNKYDYLRGAGIAQKEAQRRLKEMVSMKPEAFGPRVGGSPDYLRAYAANEAALRTPVSAPSSVGQLPAYKIEKPELLKQQRDLRANPLTDEEKKKLLDAKKQALPKYDIGQMRRIKENGKVVPLPLPQW